ncbi:non-specific lipid-transfer protein-like protein At2g13820 isoform X2 [Cajanus cajan]|uniref:non-specific lipid-transfer protein-like protein At2g13820 isoform X2 n=1 Tax=Cajanus cajan TaxID=3821 RepID=UPI00098D8E97|nr:non-specific lipid-transfer protein-like protein At2g13820 isoform X2 [Cajanus cajan]
MEMGVVLVVMSMVCAVGVAQTQSSCTSVLLNLSPCLDYISGNSSTPSSSCCTQLATVVRSQPQWQCLCQVLNGGGSSLGLNINQTQALALPSACNIQTPPISLCNGASPAESPNWNPSDNASSSSTLNLSIPLLLLLLAVAPTYASTFGTLLL